MQSDIKTKIISYLTNQNGWVNTNTISSHFDISPRSVKYCISMINNDYPDLISSSNKGYQIDKLKSSTILQSDNDNGVPKNYYERKRYIINTLLLQKQKETITSLSDYLCISPSTLQNELSKIRNEISPYNLILHIKNDLVTISGVEKDKRAIILDMINEEVKETNYSLDKIQTIFSDIDLKEINEIVTSVLQKYEYFLDNYSLLNYVLHLALTVSLRDGFDKNYVDNFDKNQIKNDISQIENLASSHVNLIVKDIYQELKKKYNQNYGLYDIYEASMLMMTRVISHDVESTSLNQVKETVGPEIVSLLEEIVESVDKTYCVSLNNEPFLVRFAFHLKNLISRLELKLSINNLQFDSIKNGYPLIYAISVHISYVITKRIGYSLPEDEIAYITLHLGMLMEEQKAVKEKVKAIIVCSDYNNLGKKMFNKLNILFPESLLITNIVTNLTPELDLSDIELIISSEPLDNSVTIRHYITQPIISENDIKELFECIDNIKAQRIKNFIREKILYFFQEDLFFTDTNYVSDVEVIEALCDTMISKQYVEPNYKALIYEHEDIAPSSYGNIAIPHPLNNNAKSSRIAVSIHPKPIKWGMNKVNLVFMLSLTEDDRELFSTIFNFLVQVLKDETITSNLINVKSFDEFVNILVSSY